MLRTTYMAIKAQIVRNHLAIRVAIMKNLANKLVLNQDIQKGKKFSYLVSLLNFIDP